MSEPAYSDVCGGATGHAEVIQLTFDPEVISYRELLDIFWNTHDPTRPNKDGMDRPSQYRSVVFYHDDAQLAAAKDLKAEFEKKGTFASPAMALANKVLPVPG